jgi:hypothetical protein
VDVNKFDGSDPSGWVLKWNIISLCTTLQMSWPNFGMVFSISIKNVFNGGNGEKMLAQDMWLEHNLWKIFMNALKLTPII